MMTHAAALLAGLSAAALLAGALARRARAATPRYDLTGRLGSGDLCDVHAGLRGRDRVVVKVPTVDGLDALLAKEHDVLAELRTKAGSAAVAQSLPEPVESTALGGRRVNVFRWREGFRTAEEIRDRYPGGLDGRHLGWMFNRTLEVLGFVHRAGWVHGAVLPPHLLFHPDDHGLLLVDWIHAERRNTPIRLVPDRYADWYPPECRRREPASPSADLYLAAKSMIFLAGGDPVRGGIPKAVPAEIRSFLEACLLDSPRMRGQDAWELRDEFARVLEGVYGPPKFMPLSLS